MGAIKSTLQVLIIFLFITSPLIGQSVNQEDDNSSNALFNTIMKMDSLLFSTFNNRDIDKFRSLLSEDVEFYHDKGGLTNFEETMENTKQLFDQNNGLERTLIKNSSEVYPIHNYGAVQLGRHRFCHEENGKNDCGEFKFIHLWKSENDSWKLTRIISYDH